MKTASYRGEKSKIVTVFLENDVFILHSQRDLGSGVEKEAAEIAKNIRGCYDGWRNQIGEMEFEERSDSYDAREEQVIATETRFSCSCCPERGIVREITMLYENGTTHSQHSEIGDIYDWVLDQLLTGKEEYKQYIM